MKNTKLICIIFLFIAIAGCEEDKIDIDKFGKISGVILDGENYSPLEGVLITTSPASSTALTDSNGEFQFEKVKEGEVAITARKKDYLGNSVSVSVYEDEITDLIFYLLKDEKDVGWVTMSIRFREMVQSLRIHLSLSSGKWIRKIRANNSIIPYIFSNRTLPFSRL